MKRSLTSLFLIIGVCAISQTYPTFRNFIDSRTFFVSVDGNDSNFGTNSASPLKTVSGLQVRQYFGTDSNNLTRIVFGPGDYYVPTNNGLMLSNNELFLPPSARLFDADTNLAIPIAGGAGVIEVWGPSVIHGGGTIQSQATNGTGDVICLIPSLSGFVTVRGMKLIGLVNGIGYPDQTRGFPSNFCRISILNNQIDVVGNAIFVAANGGTFDATNSIWDIMGNSTVMDYVVATNSGYGISNLVRNASSRWLSMSGGPFGTFNIVGNVCKIRGRTAVFINSNDGCTNNIAGNVVTISNVSGAGPFFVNPGSGNPSCEVNIVGHTFPETMLPSKMLSTTVRWLGDQTNQTSKGFGGGNWTLDTTGNRFWINNLTVSTTNNTAPADPANAVGWALIQDSNGVPVGKVPVYK